MEGMLQVNQPSLHQTPHLCSGAKYAQPPPPPRHKPRPLPHNWHMCAHVPHRRARWRLTECSWGQRNKLTQTSRVRSWRKSGWFLNSWRLSLVVLFPCSTFRRSSHTSWTAGQTKSSRQLIRLNTTPRRWKSRHSSRCTATLWHYLYSPHRLFTQLSSHFHKTLRIFRNLFFACESFPENPQNWFSNYSSEFVFIVITAEAIS